MAFNSHTKRQVEMKATLDNPKKTLTGIRFNPVHLERVDRMAYDLRKTRSDIIREALHQFLEPFNEKS